MWRDGIKKRRTRYLHLLKGCDAFYDTALRCLEASEGETFTKSETVIKDVSICVLAPAINAFTAWLLRATLKKKISRLYFLARDGYFMYTTAKKLCEVLNLPIECRYLSCSRYSVRIPMFHFNMGEAFDYIVRGGIDVTLDKVLNRAGLTDEEKENVINETGAELAEGVIPYSRLGALRTRLEASESFRESVRKHSERAFPEIRDYLAQEGLFDDESFAFVDSGWTGSMQKVLGQLLEKCGKGRRLHGFYWGLYELPDDVNSDDYECFYFGPGFGVRRKIGFSNCLFESIFSAPHGMTLAYEKDNGKSAPVYAEIRKDNKDFNEFMGKFLSMYTEKLAEGVIGEKSGTEITSEAKAIHILNKLRLKKFPNKINSNKHITQKLKNRFELESGDVLRSLIDAFMGVPSVYEAEAYGKLPFSDDVLDENEQEVAPIMTQEELRTNYPHKKILILTGLSDSKIKESAWYEGSAVRSGGDISRNLRAYRAYKWMLYGKKEAVRLKKLTERFR